MASPPCPMRDIERARVADAGGLGAGTELPTPGETTLGCPHRGHSQRARAVRPTGSGRQPARDIPQAPITLPAETPTPALRPPLAPGLTHFLRSFPRSAQMSIASIAPSKPTLRNSARCLTCAGVPSGSSPGAVARALRGGWTVTGVVRPSGSSTWTSPRSSLCSPSTIIAVRSCAPAAGAATSQQRRDTGCPGAHAASARPPLTGSRPRRSAASPGGRSADPRRRSRR
jgi:hypothetical protein